MKRYLIFLLLLTPFITKAQQIPSCQFAEVSYNTTTGNFQYHCPNSTEWVTIPNNGNGNGNGGGNQGNGLSGMVPGQIPIAASATTVTSSVGTSGTGSVCFTQSCSMLNPTLNTPTITKLTLGDVSGQVQCLQASSSGLITGTGAGCGGGTGDLSNPVAANAQLFVSPSGLDTNTGLSWALSKQTVYNAICSLPGGNCASAIAGSGTVYVAPQSVLNPTTSAGIWLMGPPDPNYANPPAGWLKMNQSGSWVTIIGIGTSMAGDNGHLPTVPVVFSGTTVVDTHHPAIDVSAWQQPLNIRNLFLPANGRSIVIGECSDFTTRTTTCQSATLHFDNIVGDLLQAAATGPGIDITGASFWLWFNDVVQDGNPNNTGGYTANQAAAMLIDGSTNYGPGLIYVNDFDTQNGGIKSIKGSNGNSVYVNHMTEEGGGQPCPPAVWFDNFDNDTDSFLQNVTVADCSPGTPIENDATGLNGPTVTNIYGAVVGPATVINPEFPPGTTVNISPLQYGQSGFVRNYYIGQSNVARRLGGLVAERWTNKTSSVSSNWGAALGSTGITVTGSVTDPMGGTSAATVSTASGGQTLSFTGTSYPSWTGSAGDWVVGGVWVKGINQNGGLSVAACPTGSGVTYSKTMMNPGELVPNGSGIIDSWEFVWAAGKVANTNTGNQACLTINTSPANSPTFYGPVLYFIPQTQMTDNEVLEFITTTASVDKNCPIGSLCNVPGHPLNVDGLTINTITGSTQCLHVNSSGTVSGTGGDCGSGGGGGTFSAGNLSPLFTTSVANPTTNPALSFTLSNAAQNSVFAGPAVGGAGAPSFQTAPTISAANMTNFPTFNQATTGKSGGLTGCTQSAAGDICYWNGSAWVVLTGNTGSTHFLQETSAGVPSWTSPSSSGNTTSTSLTTNVVPVANGANSIVNSSITDNGTTVSTTEPVTSTGSVTAGSAPSSVSTGTGGMACTESTSSGWSVATPGADYIRCDSGLHQFVIGIGGSSESTVATFPIALGSSTVSGTLPVANIPTAIPIGSVGSAGLSGTSPVAISSAGAISVSAIPLTSLANQAADTVVGNGTGGSTTPTALAMPTTGTNGCAGSTNALQYNTSTHAFTCNTSTGGGGGTPAFSAITSGTNTSAAMVLGSGGSIAPTSATVGIVTANGLMFGSTTLAMGSIPTTNQCLQYNGTNITGTSCSVSLPTSYTWTPYTSANGNTNFSASANHYYVYAIRDPESVVSFSNMSFRVNTGDTNTGDFYAVGLYGPCATTSTSCAAVCTPLAFNAGTVANDQNLSCSPTQSVPVSMATQTASGNYYYLVTVGTASTAKIVVTGTNSTESPVCNSGASTYTLSGTSDHLPSTININQVTNSGTWGTCANIPMMVLHN